MQRQNSAVIKGDIVWARVQFPYQFWPSLVLCTDPLGVCVSFFNHNLSPRYVIESEVVHFEENFRWIMDHHKGVKKCKTFYALLDSALKLMGQRVISSLKCRCQLKPQRDYGGGGGNDGRERFDGWKSDTCFQPNGILAFVLRVAVLPWVDELDFVDAVRAVAQVQAFRGYCSIEQKRVYKKTEEEGKDAKLHQCLSLGEEMHSVTQVSVPLEPQYECQILSKRVDQTLTMGAMKRLNSEIPVVKGNIRLLYKNQLQIIPQIQTRNRKAEFSQEISPHLHSLTFDPFYVMGESQQSVKLRLLRFKNISEQNIVDTCFKDCSKLSGIFSRRKDNAIELHCRLPDTKTTAYLTKKRRRLDHPILCDCSFKLQKPSSLSSPNEASASLKMIKLGNEEDDSDVFILPSTLADCFPSCCNMEMDSSLASFLQSPTKLSNQGLSVTYIGGSSWMNLPNNASCCMSLFKETPCHVDFPPEDRVQETEGNGHISKYSRPCISQTKMFEPDKSIQKHNQSSIYCNETAMKFTEEITLESSSNFLLGAQNSNNYEVEAKEVPNKGLKGYDSTLDQKRLQISTSKKLARINLSSTGCLMKNENLNQSDASCTMFNSKVGEQSKTQVSHACSKCLHMKFPKNFNLPSKWELIKKFKVFGSVDHLKTKVFSFAGSAQVAFFQEADALTAYLYAKRKKVSFGRANVQFWLDPFEHKRGGSSKYCAFMSPSVSEQPMPLKSCLKNSGSQKKDNRKKHYKVRFTIVT